MRGNLSKKAHGSCRTSGKELPRQKPLKFQELIHNVEHHVEEEESEMFPLAEQALAEDLEEMSEEMQELKAELQGS